LSYRVTVRRGPKVEHEDCESLHHALARMRHHAGRVPERSALEAMGRRYEARDLVAARIELKAPRTRAGVDVRGDGSIVAWTGRVFRRELEGEPFEALRQSVRVEP
jgi:hypothetical protein